MNFKENKIIKAVGSGLVAKLFSSWFFMGSVMLFFASGNNVSVDMFGGISVAVFVAVFAVFFAVETAVQSLFSDIKAVPILVLASTVLFSLEAAMTVTNSYALLGFVLVIFLAARYAYLAGLKFKISSNFCKTVAGGTALVFAAFVCVIMTLRVLTYSAPNFDFGIFCNIFHNLKEHFQPLSTCERDGLLSHFAVHFSPVLYLLLPIYYVFPYPITLEIAQVLILFSGALPLLFLMRKYGLDGVTKMFLLIAYFAFPAINYGNMYDFHENCFILPLLMWMFYFYEKGRTVLFFIFAVLTFTVKEEAFAYVFIFAVYILLAKKDVKKSVALMSLSVIYFAFAVFYITNFGEGIMSGRFSNLKLSDEGLLSVVKNVFESPILAINELFRGISTESGKLLYVIQMLVPLSLIPFMSKKFSRLILLCPMLINLLSDYYYQCDLGKQYSFGITAFLFYAAVMNLSEKDKTKQNYLSFTSAAVSVVMMLSLMYPRLNNYAILYASNNEDYEKITKILEEIPEDANVTASTFLVPKLAQRDVIYEQYYHSEIDTDYLVLDLRNAKSVDIDEIEQPYIEAGYTVVAEEAGLIRVYCK